jgi:hypothetical protein
MLMLAILFITSLYKWLRNLFVAASRKNVKMSQGILSPMYHYSGKSYLRTGLRFSLSLSFYTRN